MITYTTNYTTETATILAESDDGEEKLCVDNRGGFLVCDVNGQTLYEIGWDAALELADLWGADPELIDQYFGYEDSAMCQSE